MHKHNALWPGRLWEYVSTIARRVAGQQCKAPEYQRINVVLTPRGRPGSGVRDPGSVQALPLSAAASPRRTPEPGSRRYVPSPAARRII
jgi:hypothetical protein